MNDPIERMLTNAAHAAEPPATYWTRYSARLRARLEEPEQRRVPAWRWWTAAAAMATAGAVAVVLFVPGEVPPETAKRSEVAVRVTTPVQPRVVVPATEVTATVAQIESSDVAPAIADEREEIAPRVNTERQVIEPRPVEIAEADRPEIDDTTTDGTEVTEIAEHAEAADEAEAAEAVEAQPEIASSQPAVTPMALRLTDHRLLRNGVEIARGRSVASATGGIIWFADESGERFAISTAPHEGFRQAGVARGNLMTFDWGSERFHWVSSSTIVDGEAALFVARDTVAPLVSVRPRSRWVPPFGGGRPGVGRPGSIPDWRGPAHPDRPSRRGDDAEVRIRIRIGIAATLAELLAKR